MTRLHVSRIAIAACLLSPWATRAQADLTGLYNTGVNNDGTLAAAGSADLHWYAPPQLNPNHPIVLGNNTTGSNSIPPVYVTSNVSKWISFPTGNQPNGAYDYRLTLNYTGGTGHIEGLWSADDNTRILVSTDGINYTKVVDVLPGDPKAYTSFHPFSFNLANFISPANPSTVYLEFEVVNTNQGDPAQTLQELNVQFTPEPGTVAMALTALPIGFMAFIRRRRKAQA